MKKSIKIILFFSILFFIFFFNSCQKENIKKNYKEDFFDKSFSHQVLSSKKTKEIKKDSLQSIKLLKLVKSSYKEKNWHAFHKYRLEHLNSKSLKNFYKTNTKILDYSGAYFWKKNKLDSAYNYYYKAYKIYKKQKDSLKAGKILLNIAIIQKNTYNFTSSETSSFEVLMLLKSSKNNRRISSVYNNLGIIYFELKDFRNSIKYHTKAYSLRKSLKKKLLEIHSLNNIGNVYKEKKEYKKAVFSYKKGLAFDSILNKNIRFKAKLLDNYAFTLFLKEEYKELPKLFFDALKIRDSINDIPGLIVSNIHLGRYYKKLGNNKIALKYLVTAKSLSKSINYKKDELEAMELLLDIYPAKKTLVTAKKILFIRDSIQKAERNIKESISRIQFETSEKENIILQQEKKIQNEVLEHNRKKIIILVFIIIFISSLLIILYIWFLKYKQNQKFKNGFNEYLTKKYKLTKTNLEFWEHLIKGATQNELADQLCISINGVKSRRKALFSKIKTSSNSPATFDKSKAILLYKKENDLFKKNTSK